MFCPISNKDKEPENVPKVDVLVALDTPSKNISSLFVDFFQVAAIWCQLPSLSILSVIAIDRKSVV